MDFNWNFSDVFFLARRVMDCWGKDLRYKIPFSSYYIKSTYYPCNVAAVLGLYHLAEVVFITFLHWKLPSTQPFQMAPCGRKAVPYSLRGRVPLHFTEGRLSSPLWIYEIIYFYSYEVAIYFIFWVCNTLLSFKYENLIFQHSPFDMRIQRILWNSFWDKAP